MGNLVQRSIAAAAALALFGFGFGFCWMPVAAADAHTLTPQALCELVWPDSEAAPDPQQVGFTCVRKKGMLWELGRAVPTLFSNVLRVEPGSVDELPLEIRRCGPWHVVGEGDEARLKRRHVN